MDDSHGAARIRDYMTMMMNHLAPASVLALLLASTAVVSAQSLPPDQAQLNAQTQSQLNGQNEQTQLNNLQTQQSIQQNEIRQQQLFNSMPQPGFQQNQSPPVTSTSP
jgi:ABC-type oligopeptide transport system substrate-binding subunit